MTTSTDAPFHVRVFSLDGNQYRMFIDGKPLDDSPSMDEWLAGELADGYVLHSITNVTPDGSKVRVMTKNQPGKSLAPLPSGGTYPSRPIAKPDRNPDERSPERDNDEYMERFERDYQERMRRFYEPGRRERRYVPFRPWRRDRFRCHAGQLPEDTAMTSLSNRATITHAQVFAAQSVLCVDEPQGEFTAVSPNELLAWTESITENILCTNMQNGRRAVSIRFNDQSSVVIMECPDATLMVADKQTIRGNRIYPGVEHEDEWGYISVDTTEGRKYLDCFNYLFQWYG